MSQSDAFSKTPDDKYMFKPDTSYAFTINLKDNYFKKSLLKNRDRYIVSDLVKILKHFTGIAKVVLVPEFSREGARLHFHGYINIHDSYQLYLELLPRLHLDASYKIKIITDDKKWEDYVYKNQDIMEPRMKSRGIPYIIENETEYSFELPSKEKISYAEALDRYESRQIHHMDR